MFGNESMNAWRCGIFDARGQSDLRAGTIPESAQPGEPVLSEIHLMTLEAAAVLSDLPVLSRYSTWLAPQTFFCLEPHCGAVRVSQFRPSCLPKPLIHHGPVMYIAALPVRNSLSESVMPDAETLYL